jgi:biotin carboxyl carrier protein
VPVELSVIEFTIEGHPDKYGCLKSYKDTRINDEAEAKQMIHWVANLPGRHRSRGPRDFRQVDERNYFQDGNQKPPKPTPEPDEPTLGRQVNVRSLARGVVSKRWDSEQGVDVKKGQVLVQLDDAEIRLELRAAKLRASKLADQRDRMKDRFERSVVTHAELRDVENDLALANIDVERWQLRLDRTQIRSPCDGRIAWHVEVGRMVEAGACVATIYEMAPPTEGLAQPATDGSP